jgi:hypothetical protein
MNKTVRLYALTSRVVGLSDGFVLVEPRDEPCSDFFIDTTGTEYELPDGYVVGEDERGVQIFDPKGYSCEIFAHSSGRPQLLSTGAEGMPVLRAVQKSPAAAD